MGAMSAAPNLLHRLGLRIGVALGALFALRPNSASRAATGIADAINERVRQLAKWGDQTHACVPWEIPGREVSAKMDERFMAKQLEHAAKADCEREFKAGRGTWWHIANEELAEVLAADPADRREELVQLTAVCLAWLEDMDNKAGAPTDAEDSTS